MSDEHEHRDNALVVTARQLSAKAALVNRGIALTERLVARGRWVEIALPELGDLSYVGNEGITVLVGPAEAVIDALARAESGGEWILDWLKKEGDSVTVGERLAALRFMSGNETIALRSPVNGVLAEIVAKEGVVPSRSVIAFVQAVVAEPTELDAGVETASSWDPAGAGTNDLAELRIVASDNLSAKSALVERRIAPDQASDFLLLDSSEEVSAETLAKQGEEAPVIKLVSVTLMSAIQKGASDIYIEPDEKELRVRYRIDGRLYHVMSPPLKFRNAITSCIKKMSKLDIAEKNLPQEGRIKVRFRDHGLITDIDVLVSCQPALFGETIVMSLLDKSQNAATTVDPWRKNRFRPPPANAYPPTRTSWAPAPQGMEQHYYPDPSHKTDKDLPPSDR